jgi:hypothetical protein
MRKIVFQFLWLFISPLLLLPFSLDAHGQTYYVSSSSGDDANDGLSPATAFKTLNKINAMTFSDNSSILFQRGDVFRGAIQTNKSPKGLTFGAYGVGENPIIRGSVTIQTWSPTTHPNLPQQVYEADVSALTLGDSGDIVHLFVDGELMTIARYPNVDSPLDKNWLFVDHNPVPNASGKEQSWQGAIFQDSALAAYGKPNDYWNGATLRIRNYSWTFKVCEIADYVAATGQIQAACLSNQLPEWGYFIDGKLTEIDHPGEWFYDKANQKVFLYPKDGKNPNAALVEGMTFNTGVSISNHEDNTVVENLTIEHYNEKGVDVNSSNNVVIRNNVINHATTGFYVWNGANLQVSGNGFHHIFRNAITLSAQSVFDSGASIVEKNTVQNVAMYRAYGVRYDGVYNGEGVRVFGKAFTIRKNWIENIGWTGIYLKDQGYHIVENNVVIAALSTLNDGGAIAFGSSNNQVRGNILLRSVGNVDESNGCASVSLNPCSRHSTYGMGIGADSNFTANIVENNTIADNPDMGVRFNAFTNSRIKNNTIYNNDPNIYMEDTHGASSNNAVENNTIYSVDASGLGLVLTNGTNHGVFQYNFYCNPYGELITKRNNQRYDLARWQSDNYPYGVGSTFCSQLDFTEFHDYNVVLAGANMITNSTFDANVNDWSPANSSGHKVWDSTQSALDGGSMKLIYSDQQGNLNAVPNVLSLIAGQWYRLRFSVISEGHGDIMLRVNRTLPTYSLLAERFFAISPTRKNYEYFFMSNETTDSAKIFFATDANDPNVYWLDNVFFEPVNATEAEKTATILDPAESPAVSAYSVLLINPEETTQTFNLPSNQYVDLLGNPVNAVSIKPYESQIVVKSQGEDQGVVILASLRRAPGLWSYTNLDGWQPIHNEIPLDFISANLNGNGYYDVVASFAEKGLWRKIDYYQWELFYRGTAKQILAANLDGTGLDDLIVNFGAAKGLWAWTDLNGWRKLAEQSPTSTAVANLDGTGLDDIIAVFPKSGVKIWTDSAAQWQSLHAQAAKLVVRANLDGQLYDDIIADFGRNGIQIWKDSKGVWELFHHKTARHIASLDLDQTGNDDLIVDFEKLGVLTWKDSEDLWKPLYKRNVQHILAADMDGVAPDDLIMDLGYNQGIQIWIDLKFSEQLNQRSAKKIVVVK